MYVIFEIWTCILANRILVSTSVPGRLKALETNKSTERGKTHFDMDVTLRSIYSKFLQIFIKYK